MLMESHVKFQSLVNMSGASQRNCHRGLVLKAAFKKCKKTLDEVYGVFFML